MQHTNFPLALKDWFKKYLAQMTYTVGVGRHSDEEVDAMLRHDLTMLSELLGMLYIVYTMSPYSDAPLWQKEAYLEVPIPAGEQIPLNTRLKLRVCSFQSCIMIMLLLKFVAKIFTTLQK